MDHLPLDKIKQFSPFSKLWNRNINIQKCNSNKGKLLYRYEYKQALRGCLYSYQYYGFPLLLQHFWILIFLFHNLEKGENCLILSKGRWSTSMQYILLLLRRSEPLYSTFWIDIELEICNLKIIWYWRNLNQNPPKTIQFVKYKQALNTKNMKFFMIFLL